MLALDNDVIDSYELGHYCTDKTESDKSEIVWGGILKSSLRIRSVIWYPRIGCELKQRYLKYH